MASRNEKFEAKEDSGQGGNRPFMHAILPAKAPTVDSFCGSTAWGDLPRAQNQDDGFDLYSHPIQKFKLAVDAEKLILSARPQRLNPAELHRLYADTPVPQHRYLAPSLNAAVNSSSIAHDPAKWLTGIPEVDLTSVVDAWLNTNHSTDYEQLNEVGLDLDSGQLTGLVRVKQGHGYSGGPSTAGSREYVAFWADWGSGFQYQRTASVTVHDFSHLPPAGLEYKVLLPVDFDSWLQPFSETVRTVKVRAVLSWNTPPSATDPNPPLVWGNSIESVISVPAGYRLRACSPVPHAAVVDTTEIDLVGAGGRIIAAAIRSLSDLTFGPDAGLTVVPDRAVAGMSAWDRIHPSNQESLEECSSSFTLYVWDRRRAGRGGVLRSRFTPAAS